LPADGVVRYVLTPLGIQVMQVLTEEAG
jgi:hypothetical protein